MRTIAHLSDLHFGREDPAVAAGLLVDLEARAPSLIAVSGDLTQRAREPELHAARAYLDRLPAPYLVVPGNHDVPLYDLASRFLHPFERYQRRITPDLQPHHIDDELAAVGVNTAHGFTFKGGRITPEQVAGVRGVLAPLAGRLKLLVAHHPFVLPPEAPARDRVVGADVALPLLEDAGVELILSGHLHVAYSTDTSAFRSADRSIVAIHAGTCMSTRLRGEPNGYNWLGLDGDQLAVVHRVWTGACFADGAGKLYRRAEGRWRKLAEPRAA